ncbi:reverse transcriptase domain-containing protein [Longitalea luteola]|uniref:reverse transcriptase domain-containing protein n=1 Tax=Longitalea luteola TaxID=2812563 RepID=UPI001A96760D|nr:reverse transcriptase domain-containing protein [Longitalea luteola]
MKKAILDAIIEEAEKSAEKYHLYHNYLNIDHNRKSSRLTNVPPKEIKVPNEWKHNKKHNPFYVLKHAEKIASSISDKIKSKTYFPEAPYEKSIPKKSGGNRTISVYQLPDSAVSDKFYHDLLKKNKHRFSSFAYAYRNDRNVHFAIQDISNELSKTSRIFIAEFDFSNFFGSIDHSYISRQLKENCFLISATEEYIINSFLKKSDVGIPLGTSISLFLANVACWQLDRKLEDEGLRFARYADDTIIWTKDYSKICKAFEIINEFSKSAGIQINYEKSDGISLLQKKGMRSEFAFPKSYVEFLGYRISVENIGIRKSSVLNIKKQISYLLYKNLLHPIKSNPIKAARFPTPAKDADLLTTISEIRRFLYGNLSEQTLKKYLNGTYVKLNFKGIMSFYPLVNDESQMKELDKWLVSTILNTLRKRQKILQSLHYPTSFFPFNVTATNIINEFKNKTVNGKKGLFQIPSFLRIYLALQLGVKNLGIDRVMNPDSKYYDNW